LPLSDPWKGLTLDIAAQFQYQASIVNFTGSYIPGGDCSLHVDIQRFDLASLQQLYEAVKHEPLKTPNVDVTIESADLTIASGKGFSATLNNINIAGHGSANAVLSFSSTGSIIHAELGTVQFGEVTINSAYIQLDLQPASSSKSSDAFIYGDIKFEALETDVAVHLYPSAPDVVPKRIEWTVYAELTSSDNTLSLSKLEPRLKGTAFDLALKDVVFIAASQDDPDVGTVITSAYKPKEGVQVFATFDEIPVFNSLAKSKVTGMVLNASWSRSAGFNLNVFLPVARNLVLGKGITTTPVELSLDMTPSPIDKAKLIPCLRVAAGLYIPVTHSPKPLLFEMILTAKETDATITAELKGNWVDPFGISDEVVIGPLLALQADLDYVTGLSGIVFEGGLSIGNTTANVTVSVNEDPMKELLSAEIDNLNFTDLVSFGEKLLHLKFSPPPNDFLEFQKLKWYICPAPLTINNVVYPSGFSFESDMTLFGKTANASVAASDTLLSIKGSVGDFVVGPLKVSGLDDPKKASFQVQVGKDIQHLLLDGAVTLYVETYALHLLVETQPSPKISFTTEFKLTELLTFEVDAKLIGVLNFKDLSKLDFIFDAYLQQHLLDYIHDELLNVLTKAKQAADEGIEAAKKKVAAEKTALDNRISKAQEDLKAIQEKWEAHQESVKKTNQLIIDGYNADIQSRRDSITRAEKAYDAAVQSAQTKLTNALHDQQVKIWAAENDLENVKRKVASDTDDANRKVAAAKAKMDHDFGSAEQNIEDAERKVENLQHQIDDINRQINSLEHGSWLKKIKIPGLKVEQEALELSMKVAQGVLDVARDVLKGADYLADKSAFDAAQKGLDLVKQGGTSLVSDAQKALDSVKQLTQAVVDRANEAVRAVESGSEKIAFDGANAALTAYQRIHNAVFEAANKAIADLVKDVEYLAFETATTALATAQHATKGLDAAEDLLTEVEKGSDAVLDLGKAIVNAGDKALNITSVHLSGSLGKSVGGAGFTADVNGVILKKPFGISLELNPSNVKTFLKDMCQKLAKEI
ncbi:hypothetical protein OG21DRAFT_1528059, partial [Imleria badia]